MDMAEAADELGQLDLAAWLLEQARQKSQTLPALNRALARLYEKRGNFTQAIALWNLVRKARPADKEADRKLKDLAVNETIARGNYEGAVADAGAVPKPGGDPSAEQTRSKEYRLAGAAPAHGGDPANAAPPPTDRAGREAAPIRARLQADLTNVNLHLQLAAVYRRNGDLEHARSVLQEGLGPTGNAFELGAELTDLEIEPFRQNLALTEERYKAHPDDEELRRLRIRLRKEINTRELELHRRKAERFPTEMSHRYEVGVRLLRGGQIDEAIQELQAARGDPRQRWQSQIQLGHCFKARNNWRLAHAQLRGGLASAARLRDGEEEGRAVSAGPGLRRGRRPGPRHRPRPRTGQYRLFLPRYRPTARRMADAPRRRGRTQVTAGGRGAWDRSPKPNLTDSVPPPAPAGTARRR